MPDGHKNLLLGWRNFDPVTKLEDLTVLFICTYFVTPGLHEGRLSYRGSLQPSKENIQWNFSTFSIFVDPHSQCGSGSSRPKSMRIQIRIRISNTNIIFWINRHMSQVPDGRSEQPEVWAAGEGGGASLHQHNRTAHQESILGHQRIVTGIPTSISTDRSRDPNLVFNI